VPVSPCQQPVLSFSATQITNYLGCKRKWWYESVLGLPRVQKPSAALGSSYHRQLEAWYKDGVEPEDDRVALGLMDLPSGPNLPPPCDGVLVEGAYKEELAPAVVFKGVIDIQDLRDPSHPVIWDHKSTSDFQWAKTEHELKVDIQMQAYAWHVLQKFPEAEQVTVAHNVIRTKGAAVPPRRTMATVDREHVTKERRKALAIIQEMVPLKRETDVGQVEPTGKQHGECDKYGGCDYRSRCFFDMFNPTKNLLPPDTTRRKPGEPYATLDNVSEEVRKGILKKAKGKGPMNPELQAKIAALKAKQQNAVSPAPAPAQVPLPPPPSVPVATEPAKAPIRSRISAIQAELTRRREAETDLTPAIVAATKEAASPVEAEAEVAPEAEEAPSVPGTRAMFEAAKAKAAMETPAIIPTESAPAVAPAAETPPARKRGRPRKDAAVQVADIAELEARIGEMAKVVATAQPVGETQEITQFKEPELKVIDRTPGLYGLFMDCIPLNTAVVRFENYVASVLTEIQEKTGKTWQMHPFRDGTALVCSLLDKKLAEETKCFDMAVDCSSPLAKVAMEVLIPRSKIQVQGIR
jgi:CRISPR/Cas system-associated exonuclease Cas4 (RecB family)